ncbi:OsmC family protein [Paractinoplanes lichenicola]|uniref:OsmC family protein n=1 Tax=Paractinoplanes lichenicola TaxID=2802976 RepID=A0ABS1VGM4_9ACTN|nr:OsmC family protein [Actinoplanes lichenicola]MBL7253853.1 OsmC family protein [Actinoplanes lichenicola]
MDGFAVVVGAGSFRVEGGVRFPHRWTEGGVSVGAEFTGAHLLHLAAAGCVLNDLYREAAELGLRLGGVRVTASGGFDSESWASTGIAYGVELDTSASAEEQAALIERVDRMAEIPRAIRAGAPVRRREGSHRSDEPA